MENAYRIEGYAIVSADGMIADASGHMPEGLKVEADRAFFHGSLDHSDVLVHGPKSRESGADASHRRRIVVTRRVAAVAPHPGNPKAMFWNPAGASLEEACRAHGIDRGRIAVLGGTDVFGLFLPHYDAFHLTRADHLRLPGGRPVFPGVPARTPEDLLASHGLRPGPSRTLDPAHGVTLVTWSR